MCRTRAEGAWKIDAEVGNGGRVQGGRWRQESGMAESAWWDIKEGRSHRGRRVQGGR